VVLLGSIAALWLATPLREWIDVERLVAVMNRFGDSPLAPLLILAAYLGGGLVLFPVNVLIAVTIIVFGPVLGAVYALIGSVSSAALSYEIGRHAQPAPLRRRFGLSMQRLGARLARRGLLAVALVRAVPVAPYSVVGLIAGAAHIDRRDYLAGTALGMLPGILVNAFFIDRVIAVIERPSPLTFALLAVAALVLFGLVVLVRRHFARTSEAP
jgi:phospholipase D1/2